MILPNQRIAVSVQRTGKTVNREQRTAFSVQGQRTETAFSGQRTEKTVNSVQRTGNSGQFENKNF